jgi:hypothetical protein
MTSGMQTLLKQIASSPHEPQSWVPPQLSSYSPQLYPKSWQVVGAQPPQTFAVPPPPQVWGAVQVPQSS